MRQHLTITHDLQVSGKAIHGVCLRFSEKLEENWFYDRVTSWYIEWSGGESNPPAQILNEFCMAKLSCGIRYTNIYPLH
jgi:hypothetical protein